VWMRKACESLPAVEQTAGIRSREAAQECSPERKPWVEVGNEQAPAGRKISSHARTLAATDKAGTFVSTFPMFEAH
jgi:hypothetical protein